MESSQPAPPKDVIKFLTLGFPFVSLWYLVERFSYYRMTLFILFLYVLMFIFLGASAVAKTQFQMHHGSQCKT